MKRLLHFF